MVWEFSKLKYGWRGFNGDRLTNFYPTLEEAQAEADAIRNGQPHPTLTGEGYTCDVCGLGFSQAEWDDRHDDEDSEENRYYHAECCPICDDQVDTSAIIYGEVEL